MGMFKKLLRVIFVCTVTALVAVEGICATVNVNNANEAALRSIKGIGAVKAAAIVEERKARGPYKNADDLAARVKGLGRKSVAKLLQQGLAISAAAVPAATMKSKPATPASRSSAPGRKQ